MSDGFSTAQAIFDAQEAPGCYAEDPPECDDDCPCGESVVREWSAYWGEFTSRGKDRCCACDEPLCPACVKKDDFCPTCRVEYDAAQGAKTS